jgi:AcrR family transcriptional regulator
MVGILCHLAVDVNTWQCYRRPMVETGTLWDQKKARTRDDLVRAALALFRSQGFDKTTVEEIAAAARTSPRTFFRYFGTKEDLVFHDLGDHLAFLREQLEEGLREHGIWEGVTEAMLAVNTHFLAAGTDLAIERFDAWLREPPLRQRFAALSLEWEDAVADAVAASRRTTVADDPYARMVGIVAVAGFRSAMETRRPSSFIADLRSHLDAIGDGLRHEPPPRAKRRNGKRPA